MTIRSFELLRPASLPEASELLIKHGEESRLIAGGTTLVTLMKQRALYYPYLVDLQSVPDLDRISVENGWVRIGAMATHRTIERSPAIKQSLPVLAQAVGKVGNVRVRETATLGGNLAHGDSRLDPPPALFVLGADHVQFGTHGNRTVPIREFYRGMYDSALEPGEILTEIKIPPMAENSRAVYIRYNSLSANDWPCLGVAVFLVRTGDRCRELRIALSGLAGTPLLIRGLDFVKDQILTSSLMDDVVRVVDEQISPQSDLRGSEWYKRQVAGVFIKRAAIEVERKFFS
ncbi:MAG: xanthine dehydrogenase family protein subunit M [Candidatus Binatia bacterium]|nr:xanthine dehydrogenase family protein subunit M [Candidatus Binatia bacterium]